MYVYNVSTTLNQDFSTDCKTAKGSLVITVLLTYAELLMQAALQQNIA